MMTEQFNWQPPCKNGDCPAHPVLNDETERLCDIAVDLLRDAGLMGALEASPCPVEVVTMIAKAAMPKE
jgi:hypothetical protein